MNRFRLIGSYDEPIIRTINEMDLKIVYIPLIKEEKTLKYGVGKVINKMLENGICPTEKGIDMMVLATLVYLADTRISRAKHSQDSWTREITIQIPVIDVDEWDSVRDDLIRMLNFLTGDKWNFCFEKRNVDFSDLQLRLKDKREFEVVSLFSGGMDSLISTINCLEENKKLLLISHAGDGHTKSAQKAILEILEEKYENIKPVQLYLWMVFDKAILPNGYTENTTRSRSFLFISLGIMALSGLPQVNRLEVPENGLIALNVPLDSLRIGSHSTRTTHPFYLSMWNKILNNIGFSINIENEYWHKTKGEMASECKNRELLLEVMKQSVSCSSPGKARWGGFRPQHCGFCVPCLIRRAAMLKAFGFGNDSTDYTKQNVADIRQNHAKGTGNQLRSFEYALERIHNNPNLAKLLIHKTGPLSDDSEYLEDLVDVYIRGLNEVGAFIQTSRSQEVSD